MTAVTGLGEWDTADDAAVVAAENVAAVAGGDHERAENGPTLFYGSVDEFVRGVVLEVYRRRVGPRAESRWSARWWRSPEALLRLEAMWRSWENLRLDGTLGMSVWLLQHGDPQMRALLDPDGPFACSEDANRSGERLPYEAPPRGLFPDVRLDPPTQ